MAAEVPVVALWRTSSAWRVILFRVSPIGARKLESSANQSGEPSAVAGPDDERRTLSTWERRSRVYECNKDFSAPALGLPAFRYLSLPADNMTRSPNVPV